MFFITIQRLVRLQRCIAIILFLIANVSKYYTIDPEIKDCKLVKCPEHFDSFFCARTLDDCETIDDNIQKAIDRYDRSNILSWYLYLVVFVYILIDLLWYIFKFPSVVSSKKKNEEWLSKLLIDFKYIDTVTQKIKLIYAYLFLNIIQIQFTIFYLIRPNAISLFPSNIHCNTINHSELCCYLKFNNYFMSIYIVILILNSISLLISIICFFQVIKLYLSADFRFQRIKGILISLHNDILLKKIADNCELLFCLENLITNSRIKILIEQLGADFWFSFVTEFYADEKSNFYDFNI